MRRTRICFEAKYVFWNRSCLHGFKTHTQVWAMRMKHFPVETWSMILCWCKDSNEVWRRKTDVDWGGKEAQRGVLLWISSNNSSYLLQMSVLLEATGGWMIDGVCVFLVYLSTCFCAYTCMCVRVHAFECLCVRNVFVTTLARSR